MTWTVRNITPPAPFLPALCFFATCCDMHTSSPSPSPTRPIHVPCMPCKHSPPHSPWHGVGVHIGTSFVERGVLGGLAAMTASTITHPIDSIKVQQAPPHTPLVPTTHAAPTSPPTHPHTPRAVPCVCCSSRSVCSSTMSCPPAKG